MAVPKNYKYLALQVRQLWAQHEERLLREGLAALAPGGAGAPREQAGGSSPSRPPSARSAAKAPEGSLVAEVGHLVLSSSIIDDVSGPGDHFGSAWELGLQALSDVVVARMRQALRRWDMFTRRQRLEDLDSTVLQAIGSVGPGGVVPSRAGGGFLPGAGGGTLPAGLGLPFGSLASAAPLAPLVLGSAAPAAGLAHARPPLAAAAQERREPLLPHPHESRLPERHGGLAAASLAGQAFSELVDDHAGNAGHAASAEPLRPSHGSLAMASLAGHTLAEGHLGNSSHANGVSQPSHGSLAMASVAGHTLAEGHLGGSSHANGVSSPSPGSLAMASMAGHALAEGHLGSSSHANGVSSPSHGSLAMASLAGHALAEGHLGGSSHANSVSPPSRGSLAVAAQAGQALAEAADVHRLSSRSSSHTDSASPPQQRQVTLGMGALAGQALMESSRLRGGTPSPNGARHTGLVMASLAGEALMEKGDQSAGHGSARSRSHGASHGGVGDGRSERHGTLAVASLAGQALMEAQQENHNSSVKERVAYLERVIGRGAKDSNNDDVSVGHATREHGSSLERERSATPQEQTMIKATLEEQARSTQASLVREVPRVLVGRRYCGKAVRLRSKERQVRAKERRYGTDHPEVVLALMGLADHHRRHGSAEHRKAALERVLEIQERLHGTDHLLLVDTLINLASSYRDLGNFAMEESLLLRKDSILAEHMERQLRPCPHPAVLPEPAAQPGGSPAAAGPLASPELPQQALGGVTQAAAQAPWPASTEEDGAARSSATPPETPAAPASLAQEEGSPQWEQGIEPAGALEPQDTGGSHTEQANTVVADVATQDPVMCNTSVTQATRFGNDLDVPDEAAAQQAEATRLVLLQDRLRALEAEVAAEARTRQASTHSGTLVEEVLRSANCGGRRDGGIDAFVQSLVVDQARIDEVIKLASVLWDSGTLGSAVLAANARKSLPLLQSSLLARLADKCHRMVLRDAVHLWWRHSLLQQSVEELVARGALRQRPPPVAAAPAATSLGAPERRIAAAAAPGRARGPEARPAAAAAWEAEGGPAAVAVALEEGPGAQPLYLLEGGVTPQAARTEPGPRPGRAAEPGSPWEAEAPRGADGGLAPAAVQQLALGGAGDVSPVELARLQAELRATRAAEEASAAAAAASATSEARAQTSESAALQEMERLREQLRSAQAEALAAREAAEQTRAELEAQAEARRPRGGLAVAQDPAALVGRTSRSGSHAAVSPREPIAAAGPSPEEGLEPEQESETDERRGSEGHLSHGGLATAVAAADAFAEAAAADEAEESWDAVDAVPGLESSEDEAAAGRAPRREPQRVEEPEGDEAPLEGRSGDRSEGSDADVDAGEESEGQLDDLVDLLG